MEELSLKNGDSLPRGEAFWNTLRILYPDLLDTGYKMIVDYCDARGLDPLKKHVHAIPKKTKAPKGTWEVTSYDIWEGIGAARLAAERSGTWCGISAAEFGEDVTETFKGEKDEWEYGKKVSKPFSYTVTYPKWCKITIKRLVAGHICEFSSPPTYWKENYKKLSDKVTPNDMWRERPYAQLQKCTESQLLRTVFSELLSSRPTFEEMEGVVIDMEDKDQKPLSISSTLDKHSNVQKDVTNIPVNEGVVDFPNAVAKLSSKTVKEEDPYAAIIPIIDQKLLFRDADGLEMTLDFEKFGEYWEYNILQIDSLEGLESYKKFAKSNEESWKMFSKLNKVKAKSLSDMSAQKKKEFGETEI